MGSLPGPKDLDRLSIVDGFVVYLVKFRVVLSERLAHVDDQRLMRLNVIEAEEC